MVKIYNSNKIIKAINGNKPKFDVLKIISEEILAVRRDKEQQKKFVIKAYDVVLKNLASSKKEVEIRDTKKYSVSKSGISRKEYREYREVINAENITKRKEFFKCLIEVKENLPAFLKVLSPSKRTILRKFVEKVHLLEEKKPISIPIPLEIDWVNENGKKTIDMMKVKYKYSNDVNIIFGTDDWNSDKINTIRLDFEDYATIEQLYNQIKKILEMELKQNIQELQNMKKYLADIDKKFATYIRSVETLNELRKGD